MIAAGAIPAADIRVGSQQALAVYAGEELVWEAVPSHSSEFVFEITDETLEITLNYIQASANDVEIDWGDNSTPTKSAVAGATSQTHTYASAGTCTVLFTAAVGAVWSPGTGRLPGKFVANSFSASSPYTRILKSTKLNESVTTIPEWAFYNMRSMTNFLASPSLMSIGEAGLAVCRSLSVLEGISNVTEFGEYALAENDALSSFDVPFGTTTIPKQLLFNTDLVTLSIPVTVTQIDDSAINDFLGTLTDVYYGGTQEQWAQISIGTDNAGLNTATIHYLSD